MKIVNIIGGLGNQMFEYAMYIALKEHHPDEDIYICTKSFNGYGLHNGYELARIFGIDAQEANIFQLAKIAYPFINYNTWRFARHVLPARKKTMVRGAFEIPCDINVVTSNKDLYYEGYWQNELFFRDVRLKILNTYIFPAIVDDNNKHLINLLAEKKAVSCHIRRGDYLNNSNLSVCTIDYYKQAIQKIKEIASPDLFCIFSDDIEWCRRNIDCFNINCDTIFVDWNSGPNSFRDMELMSKCKYNIIANSSFSWWGAWLNNNDDKIVVSPKSWTKAEIVNSPICDSWIKIG